MKKILLTLDLELYKAVKEKASSKGLNVTSYIRMILTENIRGD